MALPAALPRTRRGDGVAVSWIGVATRGIVGPTQKLVGFFEQLGSSFKLASTSCGVLKVVFLNVRAVLRCRELQLCTNFDAFGQLLGGLGLGSAS